MFLKRSSFECPAQNGSLFLASAVRQSSVSLRSETSATILGQAALKRLKVDDLSKTPELRLILSE